MNKASIRYVCAVSFCLISFSFQVFAGFNIPSKTTDSYHNRNNSEFILLPYKKCLLSQSLYVSECIKCAHLLSKRRYFCLPFSPGNKHMIPVHDGLNNHICIHCKAGNSQPT